MAEQVRVVYDFEAQPDSGELNLVAGEILTVTRRDVGDGWWEGCNASNESGLFPEAYVEAYAGEAPPASAPPPLPTEYENSADNNAYSQESYNATGYEGYDQSQYVNYNYDQTQYDESAGWGASQAAATEGTPTAQPTTTTDEFFGDEWEESSDDESPAVKKGDARSVAQSNASTNASGAATTTVGKSFNRFSRFVTSGVEGYLLGQCKTAVPTDQWVEISIDRTFGPVWSVSKQPYTTTIFEPKKESKFSGLKSYIAYQMEPSFTRVKVARRYKHFDWLHARLEDKFTFTSIPPLPDAQVTGRYKDEFIEHRMAQLQQWVDYVCRHPVLSQCEVWQHFLTCTDEKRWKAGKRKAEKDDLNAAAWLLSVNIPTSGMTAQELETETEMIVKFVKSMDDGVRAVQTAVNENMKRHLGPFKREYQKLGSSFKALGNSFETDPKNVSPSLGTAITRTGETYDTIGTLFEESPKYDSGPLLDSIHLFRGLVNAFPEIISLQKSSQQKLQECQQMAENGKMPKSELDGVQSRADVLSFVVLAEFNHLQQERVFEVKRAMQKYLQEQINFYSKIVDRLQQTLSEYDKV